MKKLFVFTTILCLILASCASAPDRGTFSLFGPTPTAIGTPATLSRSASALVPDTGSSRSAAAATAAPLAASATALPQAGVATDTSPAITASVAPQVAVNTDTPQAVPPTGQPQPATEMPPVASPTQPPQVATGTQIPHSSAPAAKSAIPNFDHIVLIMLENQPYSSVIDGAKMPYLAGLSQQDVLLSNYFAVAHPSLPNYIALMSGSTQGITRDCTDCFINQPNLADEIEASGRTWKAYLEGIPSPCFLGDSGKYVQKHNPLIYFDSIRLNAARCDRSLLPLTSLDGDLANNTLPNFSYIMPDLCNSGHDCSAATADKWASDMVAKLQASPALGNNSLIVIAFDEGSDQGSGGGQVAVVLISPTALPDLTDNTAYTHYSLLKTILTAWNLPDLGQTAQAQPITAPWTGQLGQASIP